ncbi:hypothetical protein PENSTE_c007G03412 [Penicillium steckii]|uniref:Glycosyltransferase 2-like domain-containing protein n=1 Tax=Penicillium steckii TaxID=303698 RepID=A0A1V6TE49_9EURO|nr:hypothetical protein PENSTE_c007G03412 [Penicillium steckii]
MFEGTILDLPQDQRILLGQRYRNCLYHTAQAAKWIGLIYIGIRFLLMLSTSERNWSMWTMLLLEAFFIHLCRKEQSLAILATKNPERGPRKRLRLQGDKGLPHVDVLLPCCGEEIGVILQTVKAACTMDYPESQFRVLVLDDGGSSLLQKTISDLQLRWPHLSYNSRGRQSGQVFAKSGNLNYALTNLQREFQPEFCAVLDADSIPTKDFLRATLPHLLMDPEAALVSTRQYFSNLPTGDPLSQTREHFYTCQNARLDILGNAIDSGSGAVFRRQSIVDVGLYPTYSFSEDWQLSLLLRGKGYKTFQVDEALQFGLVPTSLAGHIAQRKRWNIGHAQQIPAMLSWRNNEISVRLRLSIALNGLGIIVEEIGCFLGFAVVPLLLLCGQRLIPTISPSALVLQLGLSFVMICLSWAYEFVQTASTGHRSAAFALLENKWLAGSNIYGIMRFYLVSAKPKGSFVTGSKENSYNWSNEYSLLGGLYRDLIENGIIYSLIQVLAMILSVLYALMIIASTEDRPMSAIFVTVAWPPLLHIFILGLKCHSVPIRYLFDPPRYPDLAELKTEKVSRQNEVIQETLKGMHEASKHILRSQTRIELRDELLT